MKCNTCNKTFINTNALRQHKLDKCLGMKRKTMSNPVISKRSKKMRGNSWNPTTQTSIPIAQAYTIRNNMTETPHRERASEIIGQIAVGPGLPIQLPFSFNLNPLDMPGTRLNRLASAFQKYRFRSARLRVVSNLPTNISGSLAIGYAENPEQGIPTGPDSVNAVYGLTNGSITALYTPVYTEARIKDKAKWYNIDADSEEVMMTTQGKFVCVVASAASVTAIQNLPVILDYDVDLIGAAVQISTSNNPILQFPACTVGPRNPSTTGSIGNALTPKSGEIAKPAMVTAAGYRLYPAVQLYPFSISDEPVQVTVMSLRNAGATDYFAFYETEDDFALATPIGGGFINNPQDFNRTTIQLLN